MANRNPFFCDKCRYLLPPISMKFILSSIFILSTLCCYAQKIVLDGNNMYNISAKGNENFLIDEQAGADPKNGSNTHPATSFTNGYTKADLFYPLKIVIDLKATHHLTDIYFYDAENMDSIFFFAGLSTNQKALVATSTNTYNTWRGYAVNASTRYLTILIKSPATLINEVVLYGVRTTAFVKEEQVKSIVPPEKTYWHFAGTNAFFDTPLETIKVSGSTRIYHPLEWMDLDTVNAFPNNKYQFDKWSKEGGTDRPTDAVLKEWKSAGLFTWQSVFNTSYRYYKSQHYNNDAFEWKQIADTADAEIPASYKEHADFFYQLAARYGKTKVDTAFLRVDHALKVSGLNLINYIENGNENNKTWKGRPAYFTPYEYAAMSSADYDGHEGTMGKHLGIKAADPNMKLVQAGMIDIDTAYLKAMDFWCKANRKDKKFIWDVINVHHYCNNTNADGSYSTGISPEADSLYFKLKSFVDFCRRHWPSKEIWWSEFGYDLNPNSPNHAPFIKGIDAEESQAIMIIRCFLIASAAGVDRAQQYMLRHAYRDTASPGLYATSGLSMGSNPSNYQPHTSWYYLYTMRNQLKNYVFDDTLRSNNKNVLMYRFKNIVNTDNIAYVLWCQTANNTIINGYNCSLPNAVSAKQIILTKASIYGNASNLNIKNGKALVTVCERPLLLLTKTSRPKTNTLQLPSR